MLTFLLLLWSRYKIESGFSLSTHTKKNHLRETCGRVYRPGRFCLHLLFVFFLCFPLVFIRKNIICFHMLCPDCCHVPATNLFFLFYFMWKGWCGESILQWALINPHYTLQHFLGNFQDSCFNSGVNYMRALASPCSVEWSSRIGSGGRDM